MNINKDIGHLYGLIYRLEERLKNIELMMCELYSRDKLKGCVIKHPEGKVEMDLDFCCSGKYFNEPVKFSKNNTKKNNDQINQLTLFDVEGIPF